MKCPHCQSGQTVKNGKVKLQVQIFSNFGRRESPAEVTENLHKRSNLG